MKRLKRPLFKLVKSRKRILKTDIARRCFLIAVNHGVRCTKISSTVENADAEEIDATIALGGHPKLWWTNIHLSNFYKIQLPDFLTCSFQIVRKKTLDPPLEGPVMECA